MSSKEITHQLINAIQKVVWSKDPSLEVIYHENFLANHTIVVHKKFGEIDKKWLNGYKLEGHLIGGKIVGDDIIPSLKESLHKMNPHFSFDCILQSNKKEVHLVIKNTETH
jgi:hypothetical protein